MRVDEAIRVNDIDDVIAQLLERVPADQVRSLIAFARQIEIMPPEVALNSRLSQDGVCEH